MYIKKEITKEDRIWTINSWMPEMQEGFIWDSHLQVCHKYGSTPWPRQKRNRGSEALGWCTLSIEREIPKSTGERVSSQTRIGSIAFVLEASRRGLKSVKMKMESWGRFVRSRAIQSEWLFHQDWRMTYWFLTGGNDSSTTWVEREINTL